MRAKFVDLLIKQGASITFLTHLDEAQLIIGDDHRFLHLQHGQRRFLFEE